MKKGNLFVMSGPSGTGKGTICAELVKRENIYVSISHTSREQRAGETADVTYHYVSRDEFERMIADDELLEHAQYSGNYYGTSRLAVEKQLNEGKDVLLEIEPQGALKIKEKMPEAVLMFIVPPSMAELKRRLKDRGRETDEQIEERLKAAQWEFSQSPKYNHIIVNDDLDKCVDEVIALYHKVKSDLDKVDALMSEKF